MMGDLSDSISAEMDSGMLESLPGPPVDPYKTRWTPAELYQLEDTPQSWTVPDKIPTGLIVWGGRPKLGKSYFWKQVSCAVGSGGKVFGIDVPRGKVLYLALEDSARRLKKNLLEMNIPPDCDITFMLQWPPLQGKGIDRLAAEIEANGYTLVVIDTFARSIPGLDQDKAEVVGAVIARLQRLTNLHNNTIVLIDHTRKPSAMAADPVDDIISSTSKTANPDAIYAMYREQGKPGVTLKGRGRDIEEVDMRMIWDRLTFSWQSQGDSSEFEMTQCRGDILAALEELGKVQATTIARAVKQDLSNTVKRLNELVNADFVTLEVIEGKKYYAKNI